jgi:hypothetical protein
LFGEAPFPPVVIEGCFEAIAGGALFQRIS